MLTVEVTRKELAAKDVCLFELRRPDGAALPSFAAGAHIDVEIAPGLVRQYSLCNRPGLAPCYRIGVLRELNSRGGSHALIDTVQVGQRLRISLPRNHFSLVPDGRSARLFAGGIGVTPILAMAHQLWEDGVSFKLWYAGRSRDRMAFVDEIAGSPFAIQTRLHVDDEAGAALDLAKALAQPASGEHAYVCGPAGFIDGVLTAARTAGWPAEALHREHFKGQGPVSARTDTAFTLRLAQSGRDILVPAGRSALDVLLECDIEIDSACEQGVCGCCLTRVLEGEPDHRDLFMSDAEHAANDQFTPCCSRSRSQILVIDL